MNCVNCGAPLKNAAKFCTKCGTKVSVPVVKDSEEVAIETKPVESSENIAIEKPSGEARPNDELSPLFDIASDFANESVEEPKVRSQKTMLLLCPLLGFFGAHDFYAGRNARGVIKIIMTLTVMMSFLTGIWCVIDFVKIANGSYLSRGEQPLKLDTSPLMKKVCLVLLGTFFAIAGVMGVVNYIGGGENVWVAEEQYSNESLARASEAGAASPQSGKTMKDSRDGKIYRTVEIGDKVWMRRI